MFSAPSQMLLHINSIKCWLIMIISINIINACELDPPDPASDQLLYFKNNTKGPIGILTTAAGAPIESKDVESSLNKPILRNEYLVESLTHFVRERVPVRPVHPKGAGAFGYFITTNDISDKCRADFLNGIGKKTPIAVRFSLVATEKGGSDLAREPRGFAVKLYTKEGNFDIVGFDTPIFPTKDPLYFTTLQHSARPNPATDFPDANMFWDFVTLNPESIFFFLIIFGDQGIYDGYRHMPGYSIHTYVIYNAAGKRSYVRFHFNPVSGRKTLNSSEAAALGATDPNYSARDLYNAIACGDYPTWEVSLQIISEDDIKKTKIDVFDITKLLPLSDFPLYPLGKMVLDRNPINYFAEVEQMAYCPSNLVRGVLGSPDKMFEARLFAYKDAQRYRLGSNFDKIPVNCPYRSKVFTHDRDGTPPVNGNGYDAPNYYPNSFNGPEPYTDKNRPSLPYIHEAEADNFDQAREYYNKLTLAERERLVQNIVDSLCAAANFLQERAVRVFRKVSGDLADRVAKQLKEDNCNCENKICEVNQNKKNKDLLTLSVKL